MRIGLRIVVIAAVASGCVGHDVIGHACIVFDLRNPARCGAQQDVGGLSVVDVESGQRTTTDHDGGFVVDLPDGATSAVLRVADDRDDRRTSMIGVDAMPSDDVLTPVITTTLWTTYLAALHTPPDDPTLAVVHVALPLPGIAVGSASVAGATHLIYNQGEPFVWALQPPGDETPAIIAFGVPADSGTAMVTVISRTDQLLYSAPVPVQPGAITWVRVER